MGLLLILAKGEKAQNYHHEARRVFNLREHGVNPWLKGETKVPGMA